jgi:hypothetical protein
LLITIRAAGDARGLVHSDFIQEELIVNKEMYVVSSVASGMK